MTSGRDWPEGDAAKQGQVREYEKQIDRLVYNLYGLDEDEIKIVEGHNS